MMKDYVVFDIETTDLYFESWAEPIEIAAIKYENGVETIFHEYLKPYKPIASKIEQLTKITNRFLENKKSKYQVIPEFRKFVGNLPVVAHNKSFDVKFMNFWFMVLDLPLITKSYCTMRAFKTHTKQKKSNLTFATNYFSIPLHQAHSAIEDVKATNRLFSVLQSMYGAEAEEITDEEAFLEVMARVGKSNPHKKIKDTLCDSYLPAKASGSKLLTEEEIIQMFKEFKTPVDVFKVSLNEYIEITRVFYKYLNFINLSKVYKYISDESIYKFAKSFVNRATSFEHLKKLHKQIYGTEDMNMIYYSIVYKLEKDSEKMKYSVDDFDYYFSKGTTITELAKKVKKPDDFVIEFFAEWAEINKETKRDTIKTYLGKKSDLKKAITTGPVTTTEKLMFALNNKNFFKV